MQIIRRLSDLPAALLAWREAGQTIALVPTMGALHEGHISLVKYSLNNGDIPVCSIFINPTQFNDEKDFRQYPVTIDQDILLLEKAGCEALFLPSVDEIYPNGFENDTHYELGYLGSILEGAYRPGHFQGVCQVMNRLLLAVQPNHLFMGQKDYQQCMVINHLINTKHISTVLHIAPTLRCSPPTRRSRDDCAGRRSSA